MDDSEKQSEKLQLNEEGAGTHSPTPLVDALLVYLRLFGKKTSRVEFLSGLPVTAGDLDVELAKRALKRFGCVTQEHKVKHLKEAHFPFCAMMTNGEWRIVISKNEKFYHIVDATVPDGVRNVALEKFERAYSGYGLQALLDLKEVERRHVSAPRKGHWFWSRFRGQSGLIRDVVLGSFVANLIAVAVSLFAMQVYDRVIPNQAVETLWVMVAGAMLAILMEAIIKISRSHLMDISGKSIELDISKDLFQRLMGMRLSSRPMSPGSLIYAVREFGSVREFFTAASVGSIADLPFVFIFLILVYIIGGPVVWVMVAAIILIITPSLLAQKTMARYADEMQGGSGAANKLLIEAGYSADTIKTTRAEGFFQRKWEEITILNAEKTSQQRYLASALTFWSAGIQQVCYVFAIVAGVYLVFAGEFTVGTIIAISILSGRILAPATQLSGMLARWQQVKSSLTGLEMIMASEQERPLDRKFSRREMFDGSIRLQTLIYHYGEEAPRALQIAHMEVKPGENVALLGSNGSGKSTLLKLLSGLYTPTDGKVFMDQLDLMQIDPEDVRRNIGYLPQEVKLFSGTLRDNLMLGYTSLEESQLFEAIDFAGLGRHVRSHPLGLDMEIVDGGEGLSIGQRQSVGLARLYLQDPKIVLLDEPTASLDQTLEHQLINRLKDWLKDKTAIISTHRIPLLSIVDNVVVLGNGAIAMQGERDEILEKLQSNSEVSNKAQTADKNMLQAGKSQTENKLGKAVTQ